MAKKTYIVEIKESYIIRVALRAEDEDDAYEKADMFVNDGIINPVKLVLNGGDYSHDCYGVEKLNRGKALPEGGDLFE